MASETVYRFYDAISFSRPMKKIFLSVFILLITNLFSFGQGTVRGKITDTNGESVIGAIVVLKSNRSVGVTADLDGNYSLQITDSTAQTLVISFIGFQTIEEVVHPKKREVIVKNFTMKSSAQEINEVEVSAKAVKSREYFTEAKKKNSATTLDYISSETIKKTGDANVSAAVARVAGVSTNGSFITVRGIGDRYVKTTINNSRIPTLDPFTNNIKLDLFPASLVDNILITKTASPDLPGDWAGAYLSIETKDYPEQLALNVETSFGYNNRSTFKDVLTSQRSSTDWLGYDNSFREHNHDDFVTAVIEPGPNQYQELVALGLGNYFNELGVYANTPWNTTYYKLGLVQLGLLAPANFDNASAVSAAMAAYESGPYHSQAFATINAGVPASGKSFPNNWNTSYRKAPLNFSQSFSIGNQTKLFGKPLGVIAGFRYGSSIAYDSEASLHVATISDLSTGVTSFTKVATEENSKETNGWSALANLAYKLSSNHSVSLLFMPNFTGVNSVRYGMGIDNNYQNELVIYKSQFYEQRKQLVYQFKSEHYIPGPKLKLEASASYTDGQSSAPDFKNLLYTKDPNAEIYGIGNGASRSYRYLSDDIFDSRLSAELPVGDKPGLARKLKFGGAYQDNQRESEQYNYSTRFGPYAQTTLVNGDIDNFFSHDKFELYSGISNGTPYSTIDIYYNRVDYPADHAIGYSKVTAGFAMIDYSFTPRLRFSGGLRVEHGEIFTDAFKYDSLDYDDDDLRRFHPGSLLAVRPGRLDELSYLPSANLIYKLKNDEAREINMRLNYSQTVARPSVRELTDVVVYDYEFRENIYGNSELKMVRIDNYDVRIESYFKSGDNISLSFFYKDFKDNIEIAFAPLGLTWINVEHSLAKGIELEGKKILTRHFDLRANFTLVESRTSFMQKVLVVTDGIREYLPIGPVTRTMFGQAPYVINGMLTYTSSDTLGLTATVSYNIQGPRLIIAAAHEKLGVYELPRHLLDFKVTKSLSKHFNASVTVRDILNAPISRSYNYDDFKVAYDEFRYGTNYILAISYKL